MSSLITFGAILSFAIQLEADLQTYYQKVNDPERVKEAEKRKTKLERARREYVVEITLEPIEGLDEADFPFDFADTSPEGLRQIEQTAAQFYAAAAPKINVRQVQRLLERCSEEYKTQT